MRSAVIVVAGLSSVLASLPAAAQSSTRIETRSLHGATVTIEEGVRVFRPLHPHDRVTINRTYLRHIGDEAGSSRYIRRIGETQPLSGPR